MIKILWVSERRHYRFITAQPSFYSWWHAVYNYVRPFNADPEHLWCYFSGVLVHFATIGMLLEFKKNARGFVRAYFEFWCCLAAFCAAFIQSGWFWVARLAGFRLTDLATLIWIEAIVLCKFFGFFFCRCAVFQYAPPTLDEVLSLSFLHRLGEAAIVEWERDGGGTRAERSITGEKDRGVGGRGVCREGGRGRWCPFLPALPWRHDLWASLRRDGLRHAAFACFTLCVCFGT